MQPTSTLLRPKYPLAIPLRLLRKDAEQFDLFGGVEQVQPTKQARQQQRLKEKWGQQGELFSVDTYSAPKVQPKGLKKPLKPKQQGQQPKVGDRKFEGGVNYVFNKNYRWQRADKGPVDTTPKAAPAAPQGLAVLRDDDPPVTVRPAAPAQPGYAVPAEPKVKPKGQLGTMYEASNLFGKKWNLDLNLTQYPSGRWGFVGKVPADLAYVDPTSKQLEDAQFGAAFGPKKRSFATAEEAREFARNLGHEFRDPHSGEGDRPESEVLTPVSTPEPAPLRPKLTSWRGMSKSEFEEFKAMAAIALPFAKVEQNKQKYAAGNVNIRPTAKQGYKFTKDQILQVIDFAENVGLTSRGTTWNQAREIPEAMGSTGFSYLSLPGNHPPLNAAEWQAANPDMVGTAPSKDDQKAQQQAAAEWMRSEADEKMSAFNLSQKFNIPKAAAARVLKKLEAEGAIAVDDRGGYTNAPYYRRVPLQPKAVEPEPAAIAPPPDEPAPDEEPLSDVDTADDVLGKLPPAVVSKMQAAIGRVNAWNQKVELARQTDAQFQGGGRYTWEATNGEQLAEPSSIQTFRELAPNNGVDADAVLQALGYQPPTQLEPNELDDKNKAQPAIAPEDETEAPIASPEPTPTEEPSIDVDADYASIKKEQQRLEVNAQVKELLSRGAPFSEAELTTLAQYSGGGGLGANTTSSNEYYTRADVANLCTDLLYQHGFKGGAVLEPSCGAGVYLHQFKNDPSALPVGVELSDTSSGCAAALNPHASVTQGRFERFLIDNPDAQFKAVTGNIPFGPRDASGSTSENKDFEAAAYKRDQFKNAEGLFLTESMDRLEPGAPMSIIVPHGVTTGKSNQQLREKLAKQGRVLGVLRLPGDAFAHTGTKTVTDVLVMQKHPDVVLDAIARGDQDVINAVADHTFVGGGYFEANPDHILGEAKMKDRGTWGKTLTVEGSTEAALQKAKEVAFTPAVDYAGINAAPTDPQQAKAGDTMFVGGIMYRLEGKPLRWHKIGRPGESEPMATDPEAYGVSTLAEAEERLSDPGRRATIHPDHLPNYLRMAAGKLPEREVAGFRSAIAALDHAKTPAEREKFVHAVLLASHLRDVQQSEASEMELKQALGMLQEYRDKYGNPSTDRRLNAIALDHAQVLTLQGAFDESGKISDYFAGTLNTEGRQFSDAAAAATEAYRANSGRAVELDQVREFYDSDLSDDDLRAQVLADPAIGYSMGQFMPINQMVKGDGYALLRSFEAQLESAVDDSPEARKLQAQIELTRSKMDTRPIDAIAVSLWNVGSFIPVEALNEFLADTGYDLNLEPDPDKPGRFKATNIDLEDKDVWKNHSGLKKDKTRLGIYWEVNGDKYNSTLTATPGLKLNKAIANVEGEFKDWLIGSRYASEVEDSYNQAFNAQILTEYDGSPMEIAGIDQKEGKRFHDYQYSTIRQMADQGRGIVSLGVGLGKTATAIGLSQHLKELGRAKKPGIVVPKSVLSNWVKEIKFWAPDTNLMILGMSQVYWKDGSEAYELPGYQIAMDGDRQMTFKGGEPQLKLIGEMAGHKLKTTGSGANQTYARDEAGNYLAYDEEDEDVPAAKRDYTAIAADQLDSVSTPLYGGGAGQPVRDGNGNFVAYADSDRRREKPISLTEGQLKKDGILAMATDDRATKERKMQQTSQNNYDIVLMSEPVCQRINVSPERYGEYIQGAVGKHLNPDSGATKGMVTAAAQRLAADDDGPEEGEVKEGAEGLLEFRDGRWRRMEGEDDLKRGYAKIKQQEQVTGKMLDRNLERTTNIYWEDLGIDALIGDEAHHYKNLWAPFRSESDIAFVSSAVSKRSMDWFFKCQYTRESNNGQNTYLLTATPTTNNPLEAYNMLQHVCPDELEARGIHNIDHFLDHFGRIEEISTLNFALDATTKKGLVGFENLNDLRKMFKQYCRMESATSLKAKGNTTFSQPEEAATVHTIEMSPKQKAVYEQLRERAKEMIEKMKSGEEREEGDDHVFSIISDMDKAALDINYYEETRSEHSLSAELETEGDRRSPKIEACASQVMASHAGQGGKQIVFCDSVQMHEAIRQKLIAAGYPAEQIAICNATTMPSPNDRQRLSQAYNSGQITMVIGNTATMGEGMNFNIGTTDIHHLNQPWTPAAVEQRNGRGIRQGNKLDEVATHYYVSDGSFDAYRQDTNARKANWIDDLWNGTEDSSENLETTGDDMAILLGDGADVLERIKASKEAAAAKKIKEGKAAAMRGFKALQQQKARYQKMSPEERASEDGIRLAKDIERTVKRLANDPHFELKGLLDSPDPAYIHGDGSILAVGQYVQDHQSWGSKIYRVTGIDLAKKKITAVEAAGGDRDPDSFDPSETHEMPLSLFASTDREVETKQNSMKGRGYEKRQAQGKVIRPVEYNDDIHRERIVSKKGYGGLRSLPPEWIDANRDKVSDLLKDGHATVIVQKADGSFSKNYAWGGGEEEGDRLVLPSDGAAIDTMLRAYAKANVEGKRDYSLGNYINELLGSGAQYQPDVVAKINSYEAEFKAMAEQGPKEGDRKTEGGVEYELRGGRWHRVGGDEPAATGAAAVPNADSIKAAMADIGQLSNPTMQRVLASSISGAMTMGESGDTLRQTILETLDSGQRIGYFRPMAASAKEAIADELISKITPQAQTPVSTPEPAARFSSRVPEATVDAVLDSKLPASVKPAARAKVKERISDALSELGHADHLDANIAKLQVATKRTLRAGREIGHVGDDFDLDAASEAIAIAIASQIDQALPSAPSAAAPAPADGSAGKLVGWKALADQFGGGRAERIEQAILTTKKEGWVGNTMKEREVKRAIAESLGRGDADVANPEDVSAAFELAKQHYAGAGAPAPAAAELATPAIATPTPHPDPTGVIVSAYQALYNNDQDGASEQNGIGFNGMHTPYRYVGGQQTVNNEFVAGMIERIQNGDPLTPNQHIASLKVLNTYRKQLSGHGINLPSMEELEAAVAAMPAPAPKRGPDKPRDNWTRQDYAREVVAALKETADDHGFDPNIWDRKGAMRVYLNTNGPKTGPGYIDIHDDGTISNQTSLPDEHPVFSIAAGAGNGFKQPERAKLDSKTPPTRAQFAQYLEQELNAHPDTALKASVWTGGRHVRVYLNEPDMDRKKGGRGYIDITPKGIVNKTELSHTSSTYQVAKQIADEVLGQHGSLQKSAKTYTILGVPYVLRGIGRAVKLTKFTSPFSDALFTV